MKNFSFIKLSIFLVSIFLIQCSSGEKIKPAPWCTDLYVPESSFYQEEKKKTEYEIPPVIKAESFLPKKYLKTDIYKVNNDVYSDGVVDHFEIETDYATYRVAGISRLENKINEINAYEELSGVLPGRAMSKGFFKSIWGLIKTPYDLVAMMFTSDDENEEEENDEGDDDEKNDEDNKDKVKKEEKKNQKTEVATKESPKNIQRKIRNTKSFKSVEAKHSDEAQGSGTFGNITGYNDNVVAIQKQYEIDPNTDNELLRFEIGRVSRITTIGGSMTSLVASTPILSLTKGIVSTVKKRNEISIYSSQRKQQKSAKEILSKMGLDKKTIKAFQNSKGFSTTMQTLVVNYISYMEGVKNRRELIKTCIPITDTESGWDITYLYSVLPLVYDKENLKTAISDVVLPSFLTKENKIVVVAKGDHVYWTSLIANIIKKSNDTFKRLGKNPKDVTFYIAGYPSERFINEITKIGWNIKRIKLEKEENKKD